MARFKKGDDLHQAYLLPPSVAEWLPEDHLAWFIEEAVDALDIDPILDSFRMSGKGEVPYDPRLMLKVLIYAYCTGIFSSRKIAKQLEENIAFRVLARNQRPSHRTIRRFREQFIEEFQRLFGQVVQLASSAGMAKLGTLAVDGSKVKANASKHPAMSYDRMCKEEERLRKEIRALTRMASEEDAEEDIEFGPDFRGDELPEELARRESRRKKIQEAKKGLEERKMAEARAREEERAKKAREEGKDPPKRRKRKHPFGKPKPKDQENFTDPESRIMKSSGGFEQCYNAQAAVDGDELIIVAVDVTNCAADNDQLIPMIEASMENTGQPARTVLADAGYKSEENLQVLEAAEIDAYVSLGREEKKPRPDGLRRPATARMNRKLNTKRGRTRYRKRKHIAEPVFGWIKAMLGFRSFSLRGLRKVQGEWALVCLAMNLRRMGSLQLT
jgi:transposase